MESGGRWAAGLRSSVEEGRSWTWASCWPWGLRSSAGEVRSSVEVGRSWTLVSCWP